MNALNEMKELVKQIDFGDIDGLYDPNINNYFIDNQYKKSLLEENKYFVIGRKGTGKSALYNWLHTNQVKDSIMVTNKSFNDFPFEKLLQLSDDEFSKPNQYQSIWKNIIFSELANLIVCDQSNPIDEDSIELKKYIEHVFGSNLTDLHKEITRKVRKTSDSIGYNSTRKGFEQGVEVDLYDGYKNLTKINERLKILLSSYLKRHETKQYIIQFDQLDDNYTIFVNNTSYIQCIISLFKSIYQINQSFRMDRIPVKVIAYLRSDIFNQFNKYDPESSRWEQYVLKLNWSIINKNDWYDSDLLKLLNARINNSIPSLDVKSSFHKIFNKHLLKLNANRRRNKPGEDVFKYLVHRTFQRPRDLIQFCIKIQSEVKATNSFTFQTIFNAEKEYSLWLLGEIENEIAPIINNTESLYELLRLLGRGHYSITTFRAKYQSYSTELNNIHYEELLRILYSFGVIHNVRVENNVIQEIFSIIRNDRSVFNRDLNLVTHSGFYEGLHASKFLKR